MVEFEDNLIKPFDTVVNFDEDFLTGDLFTYILNLNSDSAANMDFVTFSPAVFCRGNRKSSSACQPQTVPKLRTKQIVRRWRSLPPLIPERVKQSNRLQLYDVLGGSKSLDNPLNILTRRPSDNASADVCPPASCFIFRCRSQVDFYGLKQDHSFQSNPSHASLDFSVNRFARRTTIGHKITPFTISHTYPTENCEPSANATRGNSVSPVSSSDRAHNATIRFQSSESRLLDNLPKFVGKEKPIYRSSSGGSDYAGLISTNTIPYLKAKIAELYADLESVRCAHLQAVEHEADLKEVVSSLQSSRDWYEDQLSLAQSVRTKLELETERLRALLKGRTENNHKLIHENACLQAQLACSLASLAEAKRSLSSQLESIRVDMIEREAVFQRIANERATFEELSLQRSDELNSLRAEVCSLMTELKASNAQVVQQHSRLEQLEKCVADSEARCLSLEELVQSLNRRCQQQSSQLEEQLLMCSDAADRIKSLESDCAQKNSVILSLMEEKQSLSATLSAACKEKDVLDSYLCNLKNKLSQVEESFEKVRLELNTKNTHLTCLTDQHNQLVRQLDDALARLSDSHDTITNLKLEKDTLLARLESSNDIIFQEKILNDHSSASNSEQLIVSFVSPDALIPSAWVPTARLDIQTENPVCGFADAEQDTTVGYATPLYSGYNFSFKKPDVIPQLTTTGALATRTSCHTNNWSGDSSSDIHLFNGNTVQTHLSDATTLRPCVELTPGTMHNPTNHHATQFECRNELYVGNNSGLSVCLKPYPAIPPSNELSSVDKSQYPATSNTRQHLGVPDQSMSCNTSAVVSDFPPSDSSGNLGSQCSPVLRKHIMKPSSLSDYFSDTTEPFIGCSLSDQCQGFHVGKTMTKPEPLSNNDSCGSVDHLRHGVSHGLSVNEAFNPELSCVGLGMQKGDRFKLYVDCSSVYQNCAGTQCDNLYANHLEQETEKLHKELVAANCALDAALSELSTVRADLAQQTARAERERVAYQDVIKSRQEAVLEQESLREKLILLQADFTELCKDKQRLQNEVDTLHSRYFANSSAHLNEIEALNAVIKTITVHLNKTSSSLSEAIDEKLAYQAELTRLKDRVRAHLDCFRLFSCLDISERSLCNISDPKCSRSKFLTAIGVNVKGIGGLLTEGYDFSLLSNKPLIELNKCFETLRAEINNLENQVVHHTMAIHDTFGNSLPECNAVKIEQPN